MLAADAIAINRLRVSGDSASTRRVAGEITRNGWAMPLPSHLQDAWVLVRELEVSGKPREIKQLAARGLREQLDGARDARLGGLDAANAIWFSSFPALLSFLLVDLALGRAARWYWQQWAHLLKYTRRDAIAQLLCEHTEYMPAVFSQLLAQGQLGHVWVQLDDSTARTLSQQLLKHYGLPLLDPRSGIMSVNQPQVYLKEDHPMLDKRILRQWLPLVAHLPTGDGRVVLAASILGLSHAPLALANDPAIFFKAFIRALGMNLESQDRSVIARNAKLPPSTEAALQIQTSTPGLPNDREPQTSRHSAETRSFQEYPERPKQPEVSVTTYGLSRKDEATLTSAQSLPSRKTPAEQVDILSQEQPTEDRQVPTQTYKPRATVADESATLSEDFTFFTDFGGFFYLLNPLSRMLSPAILADQKDLNGWRWLWDLHLLLARHFPASAALDWPLKRFLLQQMAPAATPAELNDLLINMSGQEPSDFAAQLFARFESEYGASPMWQELVQGQELAQGAGFVKVQAKVMATASHLDIYLPLNAVRLDLRLAAWDINPGWLPWLGRVVTFHYLEDNRGDGE